MIPTSIYINFNELLPYSHMWRKKEEKEIKNKLEKKQIKNKLKKRNKLK